MLEGLTFSRLKEWRFVQGRKDTRCGLVGLNIAFAGWKVLVRGKSMSAVPMAHEFGWAMGDGPVLRRSML